MVGEDHNFPLAGGTVPPWRGAPLAAPPPPAPNSGDGGRPQLPLVGQTGSCRGAAVGTRGFTQGIHRGATGEPVGWGRAGLRLGLKRQVEGAHGAAQGAVEEGVWQRSVTDGSALRGVGYPVP